jgi:hypothetical protein
MQDVAEFGDRLLLVGESLLDSGLAFIVHRPLSLLPAAAVRGRARRRPGPARTA